jgi:flavin reductase (DIM6/NTAB) family NADH-FMN oxidoreductase RutF
MTIVSENKTFFKLEDMATKDLYFFLTSTVAPRPIAIISTLSEEGVPNLAPFSFFNAFCANPPILAIGFSAKNNKSFKDTFANIQAANELVINLVSYPIARQMNLAAYEYASDINEFDKAGLTMAASSIVKPPRVAESLVNFECILQQVIDLGNGNNMAICEIIAVHIDAESYQEQRVSNEKLDLVGRLGGSLYSRTVGDSIFKMDRITKEEPIGYDSLPTSIKYNKFLTGHEIAMLASSSKTLNRESNAMYNDEETVIAQARVLMGVHDYAEALHLLNNFYMHFQL